MWFQVEAGKSVDGRRTRTGAEVESSMTGIQKNAAFSDNRVCLLSEAGVVWDRGPRRTSKKRRKYIGRKGASQVTQH